MFRWLASLTTRFALYVVIFWFVVLGLVLALTPQLQDVVTNNQTRFLGDSYESVKAQVQTSKAFPDTASLGFGTVTLTNDKGLNAADRAFAASLEQWLNQQRNANPPLPITNVRSVASNPQLANFLNSKDGTTTMVSFSFTKSFEQDDSVRAAKVIRDYLAPSAGNIPTGLQGHLTGDSPIWIDYNKASLDSVSTSTIVTLILVIAILLIIYRSPITPIIPLATIGVAYLIARGVVALLAQDFGLNISSFTDIFMLVIMFGAGTDYCLFLISRFKEELQRYDLAHTDDAAHAHDVLIGGAAKRTASANAIIKVGEAVSGSAATVFIGMAGMGFAEFGVFNTAGPAVAIGIAISLLASLTLTPSLMYLMGRWAFWPVKLRAGSFQPSRFWNMVANTVTSRPGLTIIVVLAILAPLTLNSFFGARSFDTLNDLPATYDSSKGFAVMLTRYSAGELLPSNVIVTIPGSIWDDATLKRLDDFTAAVGKVQGVSVARSATRPLGQAIPYQMYKGADQIGQQIKTGMQYYISADGRSTRVDIILADEPFSRAARDVIPRVQQVAHTAWTGSGETAYVGGTTAVNRDIEQLTQADTIKVGAIVLVGIFIVLLLLLRNLLTPLYLLATILLSYGATLGVTVFLFQQLPGKDGLAWVVPFFQFITLVALGMDYNILLISRVKEESAVYGIREGVRRAVASTGGIITSCGLIMAGTFASLMFASLSTNVQLGFAISFGVLLDTFIIRAALVPAIAVKLGDWAESRPWLARATGINVKPLDAAPVKASKVAEPAALAQFDLRLSCRAGGGPSCLLSAPIAMHRRSSNAATFQLCPIAYCAVGQIVIQ